MRFMLEGRRGATTAAVFGALLSLAVQPAKAAEDLDSDCPVFEGQSHAQILHGVEGRLDGDWQLAIRTTQRSAKRIKDKGEDPSQAEHFVVVLECLRDEVADGRHADAVARAKADPRALQQSQASQGSGSTQTAGQSSTPPSPSTQLSPAPAPDEEPAAEEPAAEETAVEETVVEETAVEETATASVETTPPEPEPIVVGSDQTAINAGSGVALPGTAESYGIGGTEGQQAALPVLNADVDYVGKACTYFTRPFKETVNGVEHYNRYSEGEWVCHAGTMYSCVGGVWDNKGACKNYSRWETRLSETLEAEPR